MAQIRSFEDSVDAIFLIGDYTFRGTLLRDLKKNRRIRLTDKEAAVLRLLCRADGRVVSRTTMVEAIWGKQAHSLETHIYRLRQKMEPDPAFARYLITERGGIRLDLNPASSI